MSICHQARAFADMAVFTAAMVMEFVLVGSFETSVEGGKLLDWCGGFLCMFRGCNHTSGRLSNSARRSKSGPPPEISRQLGLH